jgi:hypothetical protein
VFDLFSRAESLATAICFDKDRQDKAENKNADVSRSIPLFRKDKIEDEIKHVGEYYKEIRFQDLLCMSIVQL